MQGNCPGGRGRGGRVQGVDLPPILAPVDGRFLRHAASVGLQGTVPVASDLRPDAAWGCQRLWKLQQGMEGEVGALERRGGKGGS